MQGLEPGHMAPCDSDIKGAPDDALIYYRQAFAFKADNGPAHNRLGIWLSKQGKLDEAAAAFRRALFLNPDFAAAHRNLGNTFSAQGKSHEALTCLQEANRLEPEDRTTQHMVSALSGDNPKSPSPQFVIGLFDKYAATFDYQLVKSLGYQVPTKLRRALDECLPVETPFQNAVDLGCGTGLSGIAYLNITARLSGVDLSPQMIDKARQKNIYDELHILDIRKFLVETRELYDLFIAIDVFVYLGDLQDIFQAVRKRALSGAIFLFSTESCEDGSYSLRETGRYAHNRDYVEALARENNFELVRCDETGIRKEKGQWIMGNIFILRISGDELKSTPEYLHKEGSSSQTELA
jgi:predicted TPR repeat methyltransferase